MANKISKVALTMSTDVQIQDAPARQQMRAVVCKDTGTSMSSVTVALLKNGQDAVKFAREDSKNILNFPGDRAPELQGCHRFEHPTNIFYVTGSGQRMVPRDDGLRADVPGASWGFEAHQARLEQPGVLITNPKLLFSDIDRSDRTMVALDTKIQRLKTGGIVQNKLDVLEDLETEMFCHTLKELQKQYGFSLEHDVVEFVVCVPSAWSPTACRHMYNTELKALKRAAFLPVDAKSVKGL